MPKTWADFEANNDKIKADGKAAPVCATFGDTWTSQLFVLADFYNVQKADPSFAADYTANKAHYADTPAAQAGFKHLQEAFEKGWWQKDFGADKFEIGQQKLAQGKCAHYPMLTFAVGTMATNFPDNINDIGFFGQPGDDAATNGSTIWMPAATYIPKTTKNVDAAKQFLAFISSVDGANAMTAGVAPSGPYVIKGSSLPDNVPAGHQGHPAVHRRREQLPGARVPVAGQGPVAGAPHGRRRLRPEHRGGGRQALRQGRRQAGQAAGAPRLVAGRRQRGRR